ncbi:MAG: hypothetical protein ACE5OP_14240, partial [Candidatus Glassbacteria bacterium]
MKVGEMEIKKLASTTVRCLLITSLLLITTQRPINSYVTEKVIIVLMGSVRNTEVFEDSTHQYIPRIWENIRPNGVLYNNFYNMVFLDFGPGMCSAMMGLRRNENRITPWHGFFPTLFEYYRKDLSLPQDEAWAIIGNSQINDGINYSLHPAYGYPYSASIWQNSRNDDPETFNEAIRVMNSDAPSLMVIEFVEPDVRAQHWNDPGLPDSIAWQNYTQAIMQVDSLVNLLWAKIQIDTAYAGKTALFITDLHGRHIPPYGSFEYHGDACEGCRRVPFLAVGPDFKEGETVDTRGDLIDICPTVGELLSFDPIFTRGRILKELFVNPPDINPQNETYSYAMKEHFHNDEVRLSPPGIYSHSPFIEAIGDVVHVIWTERDTSFALESWNVIYTRSSDEGMTWTDPIAVFSTDDPADQVITVGSLSGNSSGIGIITTSYRFDQYVFEDSAWVWGSESKVSPDGTNWPENPTSLLNNRQLILIDNIPAISKKDSLMTAVFLGRERGTGYKTYYRYFSASLDGGENWLLSLVETDPDSPSRPHIPSAILGDRLYYTETLRFRNRSRLPLFTSQGSAIEFRSLIDDTN